MAENSNALQGRRIAVPESRELDLFARMLEERGASVMRCPLVTILDAPNPQPVQAWLEDFSNSHYDYLILLTGEGLRRLLGVAERADTDLRARFIQALAKTRKVTRGPKPANALRKEGLKTDISASAPTTAGVIETLQTHDLNGRLVGVQLYGEDPNPELISFLKSTGADVRPVAPYVYADDSDDPEVSKLIAALIDQQVDAIAFTSTPQVRRLLQIARAHQLDDALRESMTNISVAAVGPVVAQALEKHGIGVDLMPENSWFMKPLVRELVKKLGRVE